MYCSMSLFSFSQYRCLFATSSWWPSLLETAKEFKMRTVVVLVLIMIIGTLGSAVMRHPLQLREKTSRMFCTYVSKM